jgi:hypothetical protein
MGFKRRQGSLGGVAQLPSLLRAVGAGGNIVFGLAQLITAMRMLDVPFFDLAL